MTSELPATTEEIPTSTTAGIHSQGETNTTEPPYYWPALESTDRTVIWELGLYASRRLQDRHYVRVLGASLQNSVYEIHTHNTRHTLVGELIEPFHSTRLFIFHRRKCCENAKVRRVMFPPFQRTKGGNTTRLTVAFLQVEYI